MTALDPRIDALDVLRDEARAMLDEAIARELRDVSPDFAAVIEAAHARDPQRVPRAMLDEARDTRGRGGQLRFGFLDAPDAPAESPAERLGLDAVFAFASQLDFKTVCRCGEFAA